MYRHTNSPTPFRILLLFTVGSLFTGVVEAAPPNLDILFPAGGQRGTQVSVTATGTFSHWPAAVWVDRPGLEIAPDAEKGKLKVNVLADATGVYLIRMHDQEGATQLRPFIVDSLPEVLEQEPNNAIGEAQRLDASAIVNGRLEKAGDVDGFAIKLNAGQTLVASLTANEILGSPMDAVLQICSAEGFVLEQNDDERGLDPQIVFVAPREGTYIARLFAFPTTPNSSIAFAGGANYLYRLTLTTHGFLDHAFPLAVATEASTEWVPSGWNIPETVTSQTLPPSDAERLFAAHPELSSAVPLSRSAYPVLTATAETTREHPQEIEFPVVITGRVAHPRAEGVFQFQAVKGQKLSFRVESDALGFLLDPLVQVLSADGQTIGEVDDTDRKRDCLLTQTIPADGVYRVVVRDAHRLGGFRYVYRLTIDEMRPDFGLKLDSDAFVLTPGKPLEIPVTIDRQNGFAGAIEVGVADLPAGIRVDAAISEAKGDTSKSVKIVLHAEPGAAALPFRVTGTSQEEPPLARQARFTIAGTTAEHSQAWLTVLGAEASK